MKNILQYKEITKTILLTAFITGVSAFIAGSQYQLSMAQDVEARASALAEVLKKEEPLKK